MTPNPAHFLRKLLVATVVMAAALLATDFRVRGFSADLVISQVYGGGGGTGAPLQNDFIEIFNRGTAPVSLAGRSLQYASATGTGNFGGTATQITVLPDVTLAPGQVPTWCKKPQVSLACRCRRPTMCPPRRST